jgi:hypothetical protein
MLLLASVLFAAAPARVLTESQVRQLAVLAVKATAPRALKLPGFGFERFSSGGYPIFEAMVNVGEGSVGFYAVDPGTGDIW